MMLVLAQDLTVPMLSTHSSRDKVRKSRQSVSMTPDVTQRQHLEGRISEHKVSANCA